MEYKVPQNIDIEDRIVGPLTLRQFIILLIGGGFGFLFYLILQGPLLPLFFFLIVAIGAASVGIAFVDYGGKHPETILVDALSSISKPKRLVWRRDQADVNSAVAKEKALQNQPAEPIPVVVPKESFNEIKEKIRLASQESTPLTRPVTGVEDELSRANEFLDTTLSTAQDNSKRAEPLISEVASVKPDVKFDYPNIKNDGRKYL